MRVRVNDNCKVHHNYQVTDLAAGAEYSGEFAEFLASTAPAAVTVLDEDGDGVPDGSIAAVIAWVDGDPVKAGQALEAEQAKGDKARTTLVTELTKILTPQS